MPAYPTPPIDLDAENTTAHFDTNVVALNDQLIAELRATGAAIDLGAADRVEASRDWWPLIMTRASSAQ
ncbi:MAG: hypothetical protein F2584_00310, partial [Actinobacteria bacterium]|nr:hypothetical protein [Actinomycetota bacterium]